MEKFFSLNKLFVFFCAGLIIIWASLQLVSYFHLVDLAKLQGQLILSWSWPSKNIRSKAEVYKTQVITKSSTDAVVEVKAKQFLQTCQSPGAPYKDSGVISESQAKLTYYKTNNRWILGVVELQ